MAYKSYNLSIGKYHDSGKIVYSYWWEGPISDGSSSLHVKLGFGSGSSISGPVKVTIKMNGVNVVYNQQIVGSGVCQNFAYDTYKITNVWRWFGAGTGVKISFQVDYDYYGACAYWEVSAGNAPTPPAGQPSGRTSVTEITQTTAKRTAIVGSWGDWATAGTWTWTYGPGNYNYNSGGSTTTTLYNLTPGTTYNYKFWIKNGQGKTRTYTGTFRTKDYTPPSASISLNSLSHNSITVNYSTWNARINCFYIYLDGNLLRTEWTNNASGTFTVSGLSPKSYHTITIQPHTPDGDLWGGQTSPLGATTYPYPVSVNTANTKMIEILPFSAKVSVASSAPVDTSEYGYTLLNANGGVLRGETRSTSSTYNWTGLTPETTYYARVRVFTKISGVASGYYDIKFTTPPDQATLFVKTSNLWKRGKVFIKVQGSWIKSKYIYTKVQGSWRKNNNF